MVGSIQPGDILLYYKVRNPLEFLIDVGEVLEDGLQKREYYHCAVAQDAWHKIEATPTVVARRPIRYDDSFDAFRPPVPDKEGGMAYMLLHLGERYDYLLFLDDAIRYATGGVLHLPRKWIESEERRKKICSTLVAGYLRAAGWRVQRWPPPSPEDIWLAVRDYPVAS